MHDRTHLGNNAEQHVAHLMQKDGYTILAQNYRIKGGEIDLIARKGTLLVFIEVKMRQASYFDLGDVIVPSKQKKIVRAAKDFITRTQYQDMSYRFDVALLEGQLPHPTLTYISNAFNEGNCTW